MKRSILRALEIFRKSKWFRDKKVLEITLQGGGKSRHLYFAVWINEIYFFEKDHPESCVKTKPEFFEEKNLHKILTEQDELIFKHFACQYVLRKYVLNG